MQQQRRKTFRPDDSEPRNPQIEQALLGGLIIDPGYLPLVRGIVGPDDFFIVRHGWIYQAMLDLWDARAGIDYVTLCDQLERSNKLGEAGGQAYISHCVNQTPTAINTETHAKAIQFYSEKRRLLRLAGEIAGLAFDDSAKLADIMKVLNRGLMETRAGGNGKLHTMRHLTGELWEKAQYWRENPAALRGIPCGLKSLDDMVKGFWFGTHTVLMARSGHGKTGFALDWARKAGQLGFSSLFFSMEMQPWALTLRLAAAEAGIEKDKIIAGSITEVEEWELSMALARLGELGITVAEQQSPTVPAMYADLARVDADMFFVDHLELIDGQPGRNDNETKTVVRKLRDLYVMAKDLDKVGVTLAQVNKDVDKRGDKHPTKGDLPHGGDQHTDYIIGLMRPYLYDRSENPIRVDLDVLKHREGAAGDGVQVAYDAARARFCEIDTIHIND